ncbi:PREDICTED: serine/threonine-protein phosphatase 6 regulatory ankyrin repeat subunit B-like [Amphimedon queenslandica]|uniref:Uncharacterized protein n=2 Tax=Amphimedon queenslandica TaxID=400682 RepID=A0AAN0JLN6_AMPQE|nr:PREDICTED: serine/threonine-protein phosphatase 6 regulatory ankyrin repeat subunit B-like [Amphimedon queenslandica]|eukprot:XP_019857671.1 PREDICTED: serine/threonine-protein phosphatase 6 regulatory ankyrin repeat subunit B-like [Amphimedon queenslandica]
MSWQKNDLRFYFSVVTYGSLQFKHLIPEYLYSLLFPLSTKLQQQLASIGITELTCGENKYDLREVCDYDFSIEEVKHLSTEIACKSGELTLVHKLESLNLFSPDSRDNFQSTVLHYSSMSNNVDLFKYLLNQYQLSIDLKDQYELITTYQLDPHQADRKGKLPIHYAAESGDILLLELYMKDYKCILSLTDNEGSFSRGHTHLIKYLVENHHLSFSGAVYISVVRGHLNVLKYLIDNNYCNPNATDHQDRTPLHVAVAANKYEVVEYLLSKSIPLMSVVWLCEIKCLLDSPCDIFNNPYNAVLVNVQDKHGNTPLHVACQRGRQNIVLLLLKATLSSNNLLITNKKGQTPLHLAAASGHKDTTEALLFSVTGSSTHHDLLTATDNEGSTVFHVACSNGHIDVFRYLSSIYPQGVNVIDNRGHGLLHAACERGDIGIVKTLIETHGLDPLAEDEDGITCLHLLAERKGTWLFMRMFEMEIRSIDIYQYLELNITSNPVPKDRSGRTPLHYASRSDNIRMVRYLIETFPCTPDDPDNNGYTSVHGACEAGSMELVRYFLIDLKCNALAETKDLKTMLYFASMSSNLELVRFLVKKFSLKPRPNDIETAQSVNPDSSVVKYLQKVYTDIIFDMMEEEKRMKEIFHEEYEQQEQTKTQRKDITS